MLNINADLMEHQLVAAFSSDSDAEEEVFFRRSMSIVHSSTGKKRTLSKLPSMRESTREAKWEKRRRQIHHQRRKECNEIREECRDNFANNADRNNDEFDRNSNEEERCSSVRRSLTDEDFDELRGSIELGFGFNEDAGGHNLCNTLPALDLYFAVNRQFSEPSILSPSSTTLWSTLFGCPSPRSPYELPSGPSDSRKICSPAVDDPQQVKTRLRHWAQAVACSVRQCSG